MDKIIEFRQVMLITDGESNEGIDPISAAREGYEKGVTISTIGITDKTNDERPLKEIMDIAEAGGGVWELTNIQNLSTALSMVTVKSVYKTIEEAVSKELKEIIGTGLNDMPPQSRVKVTDMIDRLGDEININCCVVIDSSSSMANKISMAKKSILNLLRILNQRKGKTKVSVISYPGKNQGQYDILCDFTENIALLEESLNKILIGGNTPTGPAIKSAIELLSNDLNYGINVEEEIVFKSMSV
ncbi:VWA domain-containing protein [Proteiniborus sp. MB09-C3]|uniref:vWA domain-containing protein n=1 Tax=Proteiniborus sp. MB09-C3 TaxID=3050072 RepID=UPI0025571A67|nr:VWA domain-containing protein [Proteiniborus sp. MB09-C3]WIV13052.1 VWA domain-containing protein [Proteiniborus sp. MB09-C3]